MNHAPTAPPARIAITGSSGLYGRALLREIRRELPAARVLGIDRRAAAADLPDEFFGGDLLDPAATAALVAFRPDTLVHLAFAVEPGRDRAAMRRTHVEGTRGLLAAAATVPAARVLLASSATVYGAWPDNPVACRESDPLRPRPEYYYSADKGLVEQVVAEFAAAHPAIAVAVTRPVIVCGPGARNFITDFFLHAPCMLLPDGADTPLQFVHEADLARATLTLVRAAARGPFNVAPDDVLTQREIAAELGIAAIPLPHRLLTIVGRAWWHLRLPFFRTPPGLSHYIRHRWVVSSERLRRELGFEFSHSSRQAFRTLLESDRSPDGR